MLIILIYFCNFKVTATSFPAHSLPLSDTRIEQRGLIAWVCPNQKQEVSLFNASDSSVEEIVGTKVRPAHRKMKIGWPGTVLPSVLLSLCSYPAPAVGKASSVHRLSLLKRFSKSLREMRASASARPPATAAISFPSTPCNWKTVQRKKKPKVK